MSGLFFTESPMAAGSPLPIGPGPDRERGRQARTKKIITPLVTPLIPT